MGSTLPRRAPAPGTMEMGSSTFVLFPLEQNLPAGSSCCCFITARKVQTFILTFKAFQGAGGGGRKGIASTKHLCQMLECLGGKAVR